MPNAKHYSHIAIIFNPNSTGDAPAIAKKTQTSLRKYIDNNKISLIPTEYAGHAREIANEVAGRFAHPLIISVSGDGGYHEVINGVIDAQTAGSAKKPVVTVIGAGNANDHYRVVHKQKPITKAILNEPRRIDLLKVSLTPKRGVSKSYYAHSYAGIGVTPLVAEELNRHKLNIIKEAKIIITALFTIRPTKIKVDKTHKKIDSLIFANISQMAKVLTLTDDNSLHDGQFEVMEIPHTSIFGLLGVLIRAATVGLRNQPKHDSYEFTLLEDHPLQVDGEIIKCSKNDTVTVTVAKDIVTSLI